MPAGPHLRSIREIRMSLDEIPGAIRYQDPATETAGSGSDPAIELWLSQPDRVRYQSDAPTLDIDAESSDDSENGLVDEPAVIFEVPPEATLADVRNHLGKKRLEEIERLVQVRGMDAYGWYTTFHQSHVQHGVHIPFEGISPS